MMKCGGTTDSKAATEETQQIVQEVRTGGAFFFFFYQEEELENSGSTGATLSGTGAGFLAGQIPVSVPSLVGVLQPFSC